MNLWSPNFGLAGTYIPFRPVGLSLSLCIRHFVLFKSTPAATENCELTSPRLILFLLLANAFLSSFASPSSRAKLQKEGLPGSLIIPKHCPQFAQRLVTGLDFRLALWLLSLYSYLFFWIVSFWNLPYSFCSTLISFPSSSSSYYYYILPPPSTSSTSSTFPASSSPSGIVDHPIQRLRLDPSVATSSATLRSYPGIILNSLLPGLISITQPSCGFIRGRPSPSSVRSHRRSPSRPLTNSIYPISPRSVLNRIPTPTW